MNCILLLLIFECIVRKSWVCLFVELNFLYVRIAAFISPLLLVVINSEAFAEYMIKPSITTYIRFATVWYIQKQKSNPVFNFILKHTRIKENKYIYAHIVNWNIYNNIYTFIKRNLINMDYEFVILCV